MLVAFLYGLVTPLASSGTGVTDGSYIVDVFFACVYQSLYSLYTTGQNKVFENKSKISPALAQNVISDNEFHVISVCLAQESSGSWP